MRQAKEGDRVKIHYTGKLEDGTVFDSSEGRPPLDFMIGEKKLMPGIENGVVGMEIDSELTIKIPYEEAFGERMDELIVEVDRSNLPEELDPEVGQQLKLRQTDGNSIIMTILDLTKDTVTLDGNHPLAGENLIFDLKLVEIS